VNQFLTKDDICVEIKRGLLPDTMTRLTISIVSHGQGDLVGLLLEDLAKQDFSSLESIEVIVTLNIPENESFLKNHLGRVTVFRNLRPIGFGANHNQAFASSSSDFFVVLNPDVRISNSFAEQIIKTKYDNWGCMAPLVLSPDGIVEDSARRYPTVTRISRRVILNKRRADYTASDDGTCIPVDWVAGIFMVFRSTVFKELKGFNHDYFMYLEDADICRRSNQAGYPVILNPLFSVIHDARRNSFKSSTHLKWHLRSMLRFIFGI